ncbi:serine/arginine-rich splicing factor 5-like [Diaphorina citri]|uniref:Serine/arginine-rich splicing factor 5-like n=1 Tax=Diaphorina citri TaxID=121845 RepID=A0A3Q0IUB3_DIACI|nr:serine/arginine-rich splicing factor 5-like [Diaphorina citri]
MYGITSPARPGNIRDRLSLRRGRGRGGYRGTMNGGAPPRLVRGRSRSRSRSRIRRNSVGGGEVAMMRGRSRSRSRSRSRLGGRYPETRGGFRGGARGRRARSTSRSRVRGDLKRVGSTGSLNGKPRGRGAPRGAGAPRGRGK